MCGSPSEPGRMRGTREHNLKNVNVAIPVTLVVFTNVAATGN